MNLTNKMKYLISIIISLLLLGCNSQKEQHSETSNTDSASVIKKEPVEIGKTSTNMDVQIALDFINSYIENNNKMKDDK